MLPATSFLTCHSFPAIAGAPVIVTPFMCQTASHPSVLWPSISINQMTDTNWRIAGMGDLNGDGHRDIVWQHTDGWLAVWYLKGTQVLWGTLLSVNRVPDLEWKIRAVGDTNGDSMADLLWQRQSSGDLAVWYMNGTQVLEVHILSIPKMPPSANWQMQAAADVNGDGRSDVLWRNTATGEVAVWYLNGRMVEATYLLTIGPLTDMNWTIAGAQDVNGDGKADILWQHSTGSLAAWYLNGPTVTATPWLNPNAVASPAWGIAGPK